MNHKVMDVYLWIKVFINLSIYFTMTVFSDL